MSQGLLPKPFKLGPRAVGWFAREAAAINAARAAGKSDDEIRVLVARLMRARRGSDGEHTSGEVVPDAEW
jgi:prophage regulatory protein